jgi:transcriptional regulator
MASNERRDLFPGALEIMVLQVLRSGPLHGYALAQHIRQSSADLLQIEEGTLYPALQRLLRDGWVEAEWGVSARNRKVRVYRITAAGRRQLQRELSSFERMLAGITRVLRPAES